MIISIDPGNSFDKIQHTLMIKKKKSSVESVPRGKLPQQNKGHI